MASTSVTVLFKQDKETKNTIRYAEEVPEDEEAVIGTLYLRKEAAEELGDKLTVEVTAS